MANFPLVRHSGTAAVGCFLLIALQYVHCESVEGVIVQTPTDAIVIANHSTVFNCTKSNNKSIEITWYHHPLVGRGSVRQDVYEYGRIRDKYKDRFSMDKNIATGAFNLLVQRPERTDAGRYECVENPVERDSGPSAELTVLDSNLMCESVNDLDEIVGPTECAKPIAPDQLRLQCSVTYSGNFPPQMEWRKVGSELESSMTNCDIKDNRVSMCVATLEANINMDGSEYICQMKTAKQYNCTRKIAKIIYALSDTSVTSITTTDEVFCSADTSKDLPCSYKWYKDNKTEEHLGQTLKPSTSGIYRCEAECKIRSETCAFTAKVIDVSDTETNTSRNLNLLWLLLVMLILNAVLIVAILYRRYYRMKNRRAQAAENLELMPNGRNMDMVEKLTINEHFIDRGTSGTVYGPFVWMKKKCVLKQIMFSSDEITDELKENLLEMSNVCKKLDHKNVLKVFDVWIQPPALYIVMEYAEGRSLDKILRPKDVEPPYPPFPLDIILDWAFQVAEGMRYLHVNDLIHRNLTSANVLLMESSNVSPNTLKIGTFVLFEKHGHSSSTSSRGPLAWMAPECICDEMFSKLSDVWSYGITVFEILTRDVPYKEMSKQTDIVRAALNKTLMPTIPDSCPQPLKDLLTKCWNYDMDKRPSFEDICQLLKNFESPRVTNLRVHNVTTGSDNFDPGYGSYDT